MRKELHKADYGALTEIIVDMFAATFGSMFEAEITLSLAEAYSGGADELAYGYDDEVAVLVTEEKSGFDAGLCFKTKDITMLGSMMLMMESEGSDTLEEDDRDAIKEICSQILASITVPIDEKLGKKVSFKVDDVIKNENTSLFQSESYFIADMKFTIGERVTSMRFFMDEDLLSLFETKDSIDSVSEGPDFGSAFTFPDDMDDAPRDHGGSSFSGSGGQNMEMLIDIDVPVSVKMGSSKMFLKDILTMGSGNIVELDESADEPVELVVNNKVIARGEVVIVDGYFGFRIKEIVSRAERLKKLKD
jgi:flagellar motor switch protein FliN/FliY